MTNEPFYCYFIRSRWHGRVETPLDIGTKFIKTLEALRGIDPIFADWEITDMSNLSAFSLAEAQPRIAALIENNVVRDDFGPWPADGYHAHARAGEFRDPRSVNVCLDAGGTRSGGVELAFGEYDVAPDLKIVTYPLFKAALLAINAIWRAPWTCAQAFRSGYLKTPINFGGALATRIDSVTQVPIDPTFPDTIFHIPWIGYLSADQSGSLKLTPEILTESTPGGGLLMSATTERLDPTNPAHIRCARIIAETLIAAVDKKSQQ